MKQQHTLQPKLRFPEFEGDWKLYRLENLFEQFKSGNTITSKSIFDEGNYPVFGGNGLRGYSDKYTHEGKFFLIGRQGALCGNINRFEGKAFVSEHAIVCISNRDNNTDFLSQRLDYLNLNRLSESSAQPGLAVNKLLRLKLVVPSLPEQQKIADYLSTIDTKINLLEEKKAKLGLYKKAMMQKLFSQEIRFKPSDAEALEAYPEWEEKRLGEISQKSSSNLSANQIEGNRGKYKLYGATGLIQMVDFYQEDKPYISIVKDGAGVGRVLLCDEYSSVLGTLDKISPKDSNNLKFIYYLLLNLDFTKYVTGSTIPHIYFKDYSKEKLNIPSLPEQQ